MKMNTQVISELLSILGISDDISKVTIRILRVAFKKQALLLHPDKAGADEQKVRTAAFQKLRSAYDEIKQFIEENMKTGFNLQTVEETDEEVFFKDNFEQFNFPYENKGSFTVRIEDFLADTWEVFIVQLLGDPTVTKNPSGVECDRFWKVSYKYIDITIHIYKNPKNKKGSKLMLQGSSQSVLCTYVFEELPKIYK